jgi:lysophospholipase L1-like esterase
LSSYALSVEYDDNSNFNSITTGYGTVTYANSRVTLDLSASDVDALKDTFFRIKAVGAFTFYVTDGFINYVPLTDEEITVDLIDSNGYIKDSYLPPVDVAVLDQNVSSVVSDTSSDTSLALRAAYGRPKMPGGYESDGITRRAAFAVGGTAGGSGTLLLQAATFRYPFRLPVATTRWRLHVRNYDSRSDVTYTGAVTFAGVWVGQQALSTSGAQTGAFAAPPVQALTTFTTPADGSEYISGWVTDSAAQFTPYTEHMLSVGWSSAAAQTNIRSDADGWFKIADGTLGGQQSATGLSSINVGIFDIFIEVEYTGSTPIVAFFGDSLTVGHAATHPIFDSYPCRFALAHGVMPIHYAYTGTTLTEWTDTTKPKWTKFTTSLTKPDAAVVYIGGNDISNGDSAATVEGRLTTFMQNIRDLLGIQTIYLATMTPRNWATGDAKEIARQAYNTWLRGLPNGASGVIDFDAVIKDPAAAANILAAYDSGDHVHLNTAGYAVEASRAMGAPLMRVA